MTPMEEAIAALEPGLIERLEACAEDLECGAINLRNDTTQGEPFADLHLRIAAERLQWSADIRQALSRLRADGEGWRPISEHDGSATPVDLWMSLGLRVANAYWAEYDDDEGVGHTWLTEDGGWIEGEDCRATHFKPLPDPPK